MKTDPKNKREYCKMHYPQPFRSSLALNKKSGGAEYRRLDNKRQRHYQVQERPKQDRGGHHT